MLEYNNQYETHPLYNHFKSWIDMEENYQDSYFIINTALYAAEKYIYSTYNINTRATMIHEYFGDITKDEVFTKFNINNLLSVYTDDGYVLPSIIHYDDVAKTYITEEGPFRLNGGILNEVSATNMNIEYVTGYTYPLDARDTSIVPIGNTEEYGEGVTRPKLSNATGGPLSSPLSTINEYYDLYITGDPSSTIYVNAIIAELRDAKGNLITESINPQPIINEDRLGKITLSLIDGINTFAIKALDASDNESEEIYIVINKQTNFKSPTVQLLNKDLVTNTGIYSIALDTPIGSSILINSIEELAYSTGIDILTINLPMYPNEDLLPEEGLYPLTPIDGVNNILIEVISAAGTVSRPLLTHILYSADISDDYMNSINNINLNDMTMPQDMLMALLMIANHYFKIALYKNEGTASYGDNVSNRTTFIADRFPKEAHRILSRYTMY